MDARETYPTAPEPDDRRIDADAGSDEATDERGSTEESSAPPASGEAASDWRGRLWKSSRTAWNWD
jgi:hypothetical protein